MKIRVIDIETTGDFPPEHGVVELGWCDVLSTRTDLADTPSGWTVSYRPESLLVRPPCPIPPETAAIHHIIDEDVRDAPTFDEAMRYMMAGDAPTVLAAHSSKFERRFITDEMTRGLPWICTYKCALRLWPEAPSHSNQALRYWRKPEGLIRAQSMPAHRAGPDAYVTAFHLRDLLGLAPVEDLIKWSGEPALQVICHIGKQRGSKWRDVDTGFLYWLLDKDFDEDVLFTARIEIERREKADAAPVEDEDQSRGSD
jgi:exodeoxyribonuclease X